MSHYLKVPVLRHSSFKPSYSCIASIRGYFRSLPSAIREDELVIVGDRILTDVVLANRMRREATAKGTLGVWTSGVWKRENLMVRWVEKVRFRGPWLDVLGLLTLSV